MEELGSTLHGKTENASAVANLQLGLLHLDDAAEESGEGASTGDLKNAVLFTGDMIDQSRHNDFPQYGLLASSDSTYSAIPSDPRLFLNTNIPFSAFVCGVQGSGKSHTTACMIGKNSRRWAMVYLI
jgi:hypothetical protein